MNNGFKRDNLLQILSELLPNETIDERKYVHGLIRSKPAVLYFADTQIVQLNLSLFYDYKDNYQRIPYTDIREIKMRNVLWRKFALIYTNPIAPIEVEMPGKRLGCPWQAENLSYLLENDFFQNSWPR
ncbi:TPA: hypothetical protein OMS07_004076 [Klebsiella aerogenes]|nr:hypothetical protein [Klebsiella aerogenes]